MKKEKIYNISRDFVLNLIASVVTTVIVQLLLYPILANYMGKDEYGLMLTIMGIANTVAVACGGSLNNTRLIMDTDYKNDGIVGDFSFLLLIISICSAPILWGILYWIYSLSAISCSLAVLYAEACLFRGYITVDYRIIINYKKNLLCNLCVAIGHLIGLFLFIVVGNNNLWPITFALGEVFGCVYTLFTTEIIKEPIRISNNIYETLKKEGILLLTALSSNLLVYLDRILLLPLLGASAVSIYTVASVFGKSLGILMTPMAGVLLSYYAQKGFLMNKNIFWKINGFTFFIAIGFMLISIIFSRTFTRLLYPGLINEAENYLFLANVTAILIIVSNMIQPSVLKFAPAICQLIIQGIYCGVYLVLGVVLVKNHDLQGFVLAALVAAVVKVIALCITGTIYIKGD